MTPPSPAVNFHARYARTHRFTAGAPHTVTVCPDGRRVVFLRSSSGTDATSDLWLWDLDAGLERALASSRELLGAGEEQLPAAEKARRERIRESGSGITSYATDEQARRAVLALSGRIFLVDLQAEGVHATGSPAIRELPAQGAAIDPRLSPDGAWVAYAADRGLHLVPTDPERTPPATLAHPEEPTVTWGLADFAAAEELDRARGFWWSSDSTRLLVARVDEAPVQVLYIGDPANPQRPPQEHRYPAAGTPNAQVTLWMIDLDGQAVPVDWALGRYEYLATVRWTCHGDPLLLVLTRGQRDAAVLAVDPGTGATRVLRELHDEHWVDVHAGVPAWTSDHRLVTIEVVEDTYRLCLDGVPVTPAGVQVRAVAHAGSDVLLVAAEDPTHRDVWRWTPDPPEAGQRLTRVTDGTGVAAVSGYGGGLLVLATSSLHQDGTTLTLHRDGTPLTTVTSHAETPGWRPRVELLRTADRRISTAVLFPSGYQQGSGRLPVLLDPYAGPHGARVLAASGAHLVSQYFADQGFAVVVADGRGTPGSPAWERAVAGDLASGVLDDQIAALDAVAERHPDLDLDSVGIRGWSFGGYLAALAVLRRPDRVHAAVAGAPVTEWRLYDTAYTERYLGTDPDGQDAGAYDACSLLPLASGLRRPLMLIHGLADDNVVAAHTLRLSTELLVAGRGHVVLPLTGVTHMTPQEAVTENLLRLQVAFLREALGVAGSPAG